MTLYSRESETIVDERGRELFLDHYQTVPVICCFIPWKCLRLNLFTRYFFKHIPDMWFKVKIVLINISSHNIFSSQLIRNFIPLDIKSTV